MTKVRFYRHNGSYWGFEETGHTGYATVGEDILCAALSAMTMLIVNTVEISYASDIDYKVDEGATRIEVFCRSVFTEKDEKKKYAVCGLFEAYFYQLMDLIEDYYEYLDVREIEKEI